MGNMRRIPGGMMKAVDEVSCTPCTPTIIETQGLDGERERTNMRTQLSRGSSWISGEMMESPNFLSSAPAIIATQTPIGAGMRRRHSLEVVGALTSKSIIAETSPDRNRNRSALG